MANKLISSGVDQLSADDIKEVTKAAITAFFDRQENVENLFFYKRYYSDPPVPTELCKRLMAGPPDTDPFKDIRDKLIAKVEEDPKGIMLEALASAFSRMLVTEYMQVAVTEILSNVHNQQ
jgi:hypothetical protein